MEQRTGTSATFSIVAAVGSYLLTFTGHPVWGLIVGFISLPLGLAGIIFAASPRVSGGILSLAAILLGVGAVAVSILGIIGVILF
ncbi:MAG: hypothetical protein R6U50_03610 [Desulfobacterales bacterium]